MTQDRQECLDQYLEFDKEFLRAMNDMAHTKQPCDKITQYVEDERVLPPGGPRPGPFSWDVNPFAKEPCDNMALSSPIQREYILKGVQITCTTSLVENPVAYFISELPVEQLVVFGTDKLAKEWIDLRLEPLIDSMRLRKKIFQQFGNKNNRKTGDTQSAKFYPGGALHLATARSAPQQRMKSKQVILVDESDAAPIELSTGEGSYIGVLEGRQATFDNRKKMIVQSTPTTFDESVVWPLYCKGDQRHWYWPCPHCGAYWTPSRVDTENQDCDWSSFKYELDGDRVKSAWFECPHCTDDDGNPSRIYNHHKVFMLPRGEWKPTTDGLDEFTISYYIPAFLSPIGMLSWEDIARKYIAAVEDPRNMPSFHNLYLGIPYKESGEKPRLEQVRENKGGYEPGTIPPGVLYLTMAVDVQRGSKVKKGQVERLEANVWGHGAGYRRWSILHKVFEGSTKDAFSGAWQDMHEWAMGGGLKFCRKDGMEFFPRLVGLDSGDGMYSDVVYEFSSRWQNTYPLKGFGGDGLKRRQGEKKDDKVSRDGFKRYRYQKLQEDRYLFEISTNHYKRILYGCLRKSRGFDGSIPPGYMMFPKGTTDEFFKQLTAEEQLANGNFKDTQRPHEALDLAVYNLALGDAVVDGLVEDLRKAYRDQGAADEDIMNIDSKFVIAMLEKQTAEVDPMGQ
jgi:phage terminase large subunit GpA-like protein